MTPAPTTHTLREQILQSLKAIFEAAPADPEDIAWGLVTRKPVTRSSLGEEYYVLGIYEGRDFVTEGAGWELHTLNVVIEYHVQLAEGDEAATFLNHCLGQIVKRIGADITLGGLALNCRETGSELDIEGAFDKYVSGVVAFDVSYRCRSNDPYNPV